MAMVHPADRHADQKVAGGLSGPLSSRPRYPGQRLAVLSAAAILLEPVDWLIAVGYRRASEVSQLSPTPIHTADPGDPSAPYSTVRTLPAPGLAAASISGGSTLLRCALGVQRDYALGALGDRGAAACLTVWACGMGAGRSPT